jgi:hypothetical protein
VRIDEPGMTIVRGVDDLRGGALTDRTTDTDDLLAR